MKTASLFVLLLFCLLATSCLVFKSLPKEVGLELGDFVSLSKNDTLFYSKFEVTNKQYRIFLDDIPLADLRQFERFRVKSEFWSISLGDVFIAPIERNYFDHVAYDEYPVVNITPEGAKAYCQWLNGKIADKNENIYFRLPNRDEFNRLLSTVAIKYDSDRSADYEKFSFNLKFEDGYSIDGGHFSVIANNNSNYLGNTKKKYVQNRLGFQHVVGNVQEMLENGNYTGGGWDTLPSEVTIEQAFEQPDPRIGFRLVMVKKAT